MSDITTANKNVGDAFTHTEYNEVKTAVNSKADAGANSDITSMSGLTTPLSQAQGGIGANISTYDGLIKSVSGTPSNLTDPYFATTRAQVDAAVSAGYKYIHLSSAVTLASAWDLSAYTGRFFAGAIITLGAYDFTAPKDFDGINGCFNENSTGVVRGLGDVTPELWGAQGDGDPTDDSAGTNDSAAFANAIACLKTTPNVGGVLRLGAKCYKVNFEACSNLTIRGTSARATKLIPATNDAVIKTSLTDNTVRLNIIDIGIDGGELCATNTSQDGIRLKSTTASTFNDEIRIIRCRIDNSGRYGLHAYGETSAGPFVQRLTVQDTSIEGSYSNNIFFEDAVFETSFINVFAVDGNANTHSVYANYTTDRLYRLTWSGGGVNCSNYPTSATGVSLKGAQQVTFIGVDFEECNTMLSLHHNATTAITVMGCNFGSTHDVLRGIYLENVNGLIVDNVQMAVSGGSTMSYGIYSDQANSANMNIHIRNLRAGATVPVSVPYNTTIVSGAIYAYKGLQRVDTEGAAATDDLDYIYDRSGSAQDTLLVHGETVLIRPLNSARSVVITNNGNIVTASGGNVILNSTNMFFFAVWDEALGKWVQIGGSYNASSTWSTEGPTDNVDVNGLSILYLDTASNNITIGGFVGGVAGQILQVVRTGTANNAVIEHAEGGGSQDIYLADEGDQTLTTYGGWTLICNGTSWFEVGY